MVRPSDTFWNTFANAPRHSDVREYLWACLLNSNEHIGVPLTAHLRASFRRAALGLIDKKALRGGDYLVPTRLLENQKATSHRWVFYVWPVEVEDPEICSESWILFSPV